MGYGLYGSHDPNHVNTPDWKDEIAGTSNPLANNITYSPPNISSGSSISSSSNSLDSSSSVNSGLYGIQDPNQVYYSTLANNNRVSSVAINPSSERFYSDHSNDLPFESISVAIWFLTTASLTIYLAYSVSAATFKWEAAEIFGIIFASVVSFLLIGLILFIPFAVLDFLMVKPIKWILSVFA